ncbi:meiosis mei2 [Fusarium phyllophilum]|uniref:Meiosis mei2 n=1 Tax=Fusarium phyllophilum TaxID=47803 RepID=A0A8H5JLC8_9HYPO|nr:meiosis mei2 [Fusarium phyllophilum]
MLEEEHYRPKRRPSLVGQEEPFPGPDNQSKMKHSVENDEHVGLFTPTAGQYFQDERRRRHSQYDGGTRLADKQKATGLRMEDRPEVYLSYNILSFGVVESLLRQQPDHAICQASENPFVDGGLAQGSTLSATASSFQPISQRFKGKNTLVFYPEGSPTVAGALSQDMDISVDQTQIMLRDNLTLNPQLASSTSSPTPWATPLPRHIGLINIVDLNELIAGRDVRTTIMLRNIPNKDGQPPSAQVVGVSLSRGPVSCFDSGWPKLFGDFVARRSVYGAEMLPRTTDFGVTPEEARQLKKKQDGCDWKLMYLGLPGGCMMLSSFIWAIRFHAIVGEAEYIIDFFQHHWACGGRHGRRSPIRVRCPYAPPTTDFGVTLEEARELHEKQKANDAGKVTAAQDAAVQKDGGIWDGTQTNNNVI